LTLTPDLLNAGKLRQGCASQNDTAPLLRRRGWVGASYTRLLCFTLKEKLAKSVKDKMKNAY